MTDCEFEECGKQAAFICNCSDPGAFTCSDHLGIHISSRSENAHKVESLFIELNPETKTALIEHLTTKSDELNTLKAQKILRNSQKIVKLAEILESSNEEIDQELKVYQDCLKEIGSTENIINKSSSFAQKILAYPKSEAIYKLKENIFANYNKALQFMNKIKELKIEFPVQCKIVLNNPRYLAIILLISWIIVFLIGNSSSAPFQKTKSSELNPICSFSAISKPNYKLVSAWSYEISDIVALSPCGKYLAAVGKEGRRGMSNIIKIYDIEKKQEIAKLNFNHKTINSISFSPCGRYLISGGSSEEINLWNIEAQRTISIFHGNLVTAKSVAFSPCGNYFASADTDNNVKLWDIEAEQVIREFHGHKDKVNLVLFSTCGKYIVSASKDKSIILWDLETKQEKQVIRQEHEITSATFSSCGRYLVFGLTDKRIVIWDIKAEKNIKQFDGHQGQANSLYFSPCGKCIVSGSQDGTIRVWDIESEQQIKRFNGHQGSIDLVSVSSCGKNIISVGSNTMLSWKLEDHKYQL